eukprot:108536-Pyramimonas_sp.AAC.1
MPALPASDWSVARICPGRRVGPTADGRDSARTLFRRYGMGTIYYRQEKFEEAEYHFQRALSINVHSSVLYCYLGMAQHARRKNREALHMLQVPPPPAVVV